MRPRYCGSVCPRYLFAFRFHNGSFSNEVFPQPGQNRLVGRYEKKWILSRKLPTNPGHACLQSIVTSLKNSLDISCRLPFENNQRIIKRRKIVLVKVKLWFGNWLKTWISAGQCWYPFSIAMFSIAWHCIVWDQLANVIFSILLMLLTYIQKAKTLAETIFQPRNVCGKCP